MTGGSGKSMFLTASEQSLYEMKMKNVNEERKLEEEEVGGRPNSVSCT